LTDPGKTQSLMLRIVDMHILHLYPLQSRQEFLITATIRYQDGEREYPATFVLPAERVDLWRMEPGDLFSVLNQKVHSQHHVRKQAQKKHRGAASVAAAPKRKRAA
jgi:hypothetical protein